MSAVEQTVQIEFDETGAGEHGGGIAKDEQGIGARYQLTVEQLRDQVIEQLDRRGFVAVNTRRQNQWRGIGCAVTGGQSQHAGGQQIQGTAVSQIYRSGFRGPAGGCGGVREGLGKGESKPVRLSIEQCLSQVCPGHGVPP